MPAIWVPKLGQEKATGRLLPSQAATHRRETLHAALPAHDISRHKKSAKVTPGPLNSGHEQDPSQRAGSAVAAVVNSQPSDSRPSLNPQVHYVNFCLEKAP